jgi:hypothetical protein
MHRLLLTPDQIVKQEQYLDLLCEAEHQRLIRAVAQPTPGYLTKVAAALGIVLDRRSRQEPAIRPIRDARI